MELSSLMEALPGFLFDEPATSKGECVEIAEWKTVMEKIKGELEKQPQLMEKLKSLVYSSLIEDQCAFAGCLLSNSTVKKMIGEYATKCKQHIQTGTSGKKDTTKAASIRLLGNSLFVKKEYRAAFKMFTRGLMFAKDGDEETPLLYANRSAAYFYLKQHENALEDIERALKFGYGKIKPIGKLLIRKGFSLLALGRDAEAKELLDANMPANENEPDFAQWQKLKTESTNVNRTIIKRDITMSQFQDVSTVSKALTGQEIFHPHERFPWLNAKIDLLHDAEKGYHLVSKEELKYGEIVALSKPYLCLDPKRDSYERCHYCMVPCFESPKYFTDKAKLAPEPNLSPDSLRMVTPLACSECCNVLYCSEACRTAAWTAYHRFECNQMTLLAKMDCKAHLALRMLYTMGSLEKNSPTHQLIEELTNTADPCALKIDQQTYSFVHSNSIVEIPTLEVNIERILTGGFLLKLVQMSDMLHEPKSMHDRDYIQQEGQACVFLFSQLCDVNESMPYTDPDTNATVTPRAYLSVDGMKKLMKHSCEATVATSSRLTQSLESNVKLLYATGDIPAGTELTLTYDTEESDHLEFSISRKNQLYLRYRFVCACTRCVRETRDCLNSSTGVYFPIACSLCGELMVRAADDGAGKSSALVGSYRCSSSDGCNFMYSAQQMKAVYERVEALMELKENLSLCTDDTHNELEPKVKQVKTALESTASLLDGRSIFLAQLYARLASGYILLTMAPISNRYSVPIGLGVTSSTHTVHRGHLTTGLLYLTKALDILESVKQGPGLKLTFLLVDPSFYLDLSYFFNIIEVIIGEQLPIEMLSPIGQVRRRYEALLKMTAYDSMVASSLRHPK